MSLRYLSHALKYATLTLVGMLAVIAGAALLRRDTASLTGRLVNDQERGVIPSVHYSAERIRQGVSVPADSHVIFDIPSDVRIPRVTFFGGSDIDEAVRYWGYCYSGNETERKQSGYTGKMIYDGHFFYSLAEREADQGAPKPSDRDLIGIRNSATDESGQAPEKDSIAEIFQGPRTCYVMTSTVLFAGLDADNDNVNNPREQALGMDPLNLDSDGDSVRDGVEVYVGKTNPIQRDTDGDSLSDGCEDENKDGIQNRDETSPRASDTDRDGLCDSAGTAATCPEQKQTVCHKVDGETVCMARASSPVFGEDMNSNCMVDEGETDPTKEKTFGALSDWDFKWKKFQEAAKKGG